MGANISQGDRHHVFNRPSTGNRFSHAFTPETEHVVVQKDKKKKHSKLATIKKKLSRSKRHSKSLDYAKALRDLLAGWGSVRDVQTLVADYEATLALKNVARQTSLVRQHASTYTEDLGALYDSRCCTDVELLYKNTLFPVHRAILAVRCPFFRDLLARYPHYGAQVPVSIRTPGVSVSVFSGLLRFLYTGDYHSQDKLDNNINLLIQLADEFGTPNPLENDLKTLLDTGIYHDAILVFTNTHESDILHDPLTPDAGFEPRQFYRHELKCHRAILAARSPFFKNFLLRRERAAEQSLNKATRIVLDESVIPRRYARLLLHALYLDAVDLSCIVRTSVSMCSLSEVQAMVSGKAHVTESDEAMEIYQIAQFLEFPVLAQGCENIICDKLSVNNVVSILDWSGEAHGSCWIHRQAEHFVREEFHAIINSPVLLDFSKPYLLSAIKSDFLQASELEVLTSVLRWGEHQLIKRIEEREPNLLTHTTHSISRKGIKKRDLNDVELRDIISDLLPHIRVDHILPRGHETLVSCIRRGLISVPPTHMIGDDCNHLSSSAAWVRGRFSGGYIKPRIFMPYYEEAKFILEENISHVDDSVNVRLRTVQFSGIPDALYMLHDHGSPHLGGFYGNMGGGHVITPGGGGGARCHYMGLPGGAGDCRDGGSGGGVTPPPLSACSVDIIAGTIPVPDQDTVEVMIKREAELVCGSLAQRALNLPAANKRAIMYQIHLRVVREFGLPDSTAQILHKSQKFPVHSHAHLDEERNFSTRTHHSPWLEERHAHSANNTPIRSYTPLQASSHTMPPDNSSLCGAMPDIAMPSSSLPSLRRLRIDNPHDPADSSHAASRTHPSHAVRDCDAARAAGNGPMFTYTESRADSTPTLPVEHGLDLDLGDGASHAGSRGSTFERRAGNSLYI